MIDYQLMPCCKECLEKDVKVETVKYYGCAREVIKIDTTVSCNHQKMCEKYIEAKAEREKDE